MAKGDHIYVWRLGYSHHGIDCGDGTVIHFTGEPLKKTASSIERTPLAEFGKGSRVRTRTYRKRDRPAVTIDRAESRVGFPGYNVAFNNCEHFATWCCTGEFKSRQVRNAARGLSGATMGFAPAAALAGAVAAASAGLYGAYRAARRSNGQRTT